MINDKPSLDKLTVLEHHGVKGMRWGVRKASSISSGVRKTARTQATRKTDRLIKVHQKALSGKGLVGKAALLDKYTWGRNGRFQGYHNTKIAQLEKSKERIDAGELAVRTILFGPKYSKVA